MEISFFRKPLKVNSCKTVSKFTQQQQDISITFLAYEKNQRLNYVIGCFIMKIIEKLAKIIDLKRCNSLE